MTINQCHVQEHYLEEDGRCWGNSGIKSGRVRWALLIKN